MHVQGWSAETEKDHAGWPGHSGLEENLYGSENGRHQELLRRNGLRDDEGQRPLSSQSSGLTKPPRNLYKTRVEEHLAAWICGIFGWLALALASVGLHSLVSYTVAQPTNEFGICTALGPRRGNLLRMVFGSALRTMGAGIFTGVVLSMALSKIMAGTMVLGLCLPRPKVHLSGGQTKSCLTIKRGGNRRRCIRSCKPRPWFRNYRSSTCCH